MLGIAQSLQHGLVSPDTARIVRRASTFSLDAHRVFGNALGRQNPLQQDDVLPAVAEVVDVLHRRSLLGQRLLQSRFQLVDNILGRPEPESDVEVLLHLHHHVAGFAGLEFVQVAVLPAHRRLDDPVKALHGEVIRHQHAPPNRRLASPQRDLDLIE